ncbi:hypothetical protein FHS85_005081 [Rhodoligotrophos appendicifer]|uniref:vWA domain-containing protein n=1 Tax=Rhodoligotrophos appendicifer TaxID=987056 RepID=UPI001FE6155A|nr:VWA domain-containing protein [Rhodoligotrophos appendicifer]
MALLLQQIARKASPEKRQAAARRLADAMFDEDHTYAARQDGRELELDASFSASIQETLRRKDFEQMSAAEQDQARAAIAVMRLNRVSRPTRRFSKSHGGAKLDPRKTMRNTMRSGGQVVQLAWRDRVTRLPPLVVLCDISGSMSGYSRIVLHFLHALMSDRNRVHVFLFGTRLTNITKELQRRDVDEALDRVSGAVADWSGGTRIGAALHEFNFHWARRVLGQSAHILIITDGLEREDASLMETEMSRLRRQAKRIIWLNPLLRFDRFEARASGIRAMLPYVDEFRPAHNLLSLEQLAEALFTGTGAEHDPRRWLRGT